MSGRSYLADVKNDRLFHNSFFIFIIRAFPSLANLLVVIWYSRHLSQEEYGNYQHFWIQLYVFYPIACFGIHVLAATYTPAFLKHLLASISRRYYIIYAGWLLLLAAIFAWMQVGALHLSFTVPFFFLLSYALSVLLESLLIVFRARGALVSVSLLYSVAFCAIHWYVLRQGFSLQAVFLFVLLIAVARLCVYGVVTAGKLRGMKHGDASDVHDSKQVRSLWVHLGVYDISQVLFSYVDKLIVSVLLSAQLSAIYYNGSQNIPFLPLLLGAASSAALMQLAGIGKDDGRQHIIGMVNSLGRVLSCIVFPVFFFLFFFRTELIVALLSDKYIPAIPIFMMSLLVLPLRAYHFTTVLQKMHKGAVINIGAIADLLLACALVYPLYRWLGLPGVALSFVISTYLQSAFYLMYASRLLQTSPLQLVPYRNWLVKLLLSGVVFFVLHRVCAAQMGSVAGLVVAGAVLLLFVSFALLFEWRTMRHGQVVN